MCPTNFMSANSAPVSAHTVRVAFDPARDGFAFRNHFTWTPPDLATLAHRLRPASAAAVGGVAALGGAAGGPLGAAVAGIGGLAVGATGVGGALVRAVAQRWPSFGLCGGMALAAIERWPAPSVPTSALDPVAMRPLLRTRQEQTLRASAPRFAAEWLRARVTGPGDAPLAGALARELDRITETLAAGQPALVGLVGDAPDPFANHQVVVFGLERTGPAEAALDVYDPNAPGQTRWIQTAPGTAPGTTHLTTSLPTGTSKAGRAHIHTQANRLSHLFEIRV